MNPLRTYNQQDPRSPGKIQAAAAALSCEPIGPAHQTLTQAPVIAGSDRTTDYRNTLWANALWAESLRTIRIDHEA